MHANILAAVTAFAKSRAQQPSTWIGIISLIVAATGLSIDSQTVQTVALAIAAIAGGAGIAVDR
ncbi:hypothetical protein [Roseicella sp. DB1501]|uniref:hypothetical protein n=1 Tax=Roseicella sp. DB1501 TaxID=2730925 RepID=UPI001490E412|nr:hypothetical protein [Roseicella sp. DB1501]NOG69791.1 hypothetical protein [Roseicella sp. DB1501]